MYFLPAKLYKIVLISLLVSCVISEDLERFSVYYGVTHLSEGNRSTGSLCYDQLSSIAEGIRNKERWALKLFDASGVPETKLHWGNTYWLGSRRQCKASNFVKRVPVAPSAREFIENENTIPAFEVEYFGIYFHHNSTIQVALNYEASEYIIVLGMCLPASCDEKEIYDLVEEYLKSDELTIKRLYDMEFKMERVRKIGSDYSWMKQTRFKIFIYSVTVVCILCIFATIYEAKKKKQIQKTHLKNGKENRDMENDESKTPVESGTGKLEELLLCFSIRRNYNYIMNPQLSDGSLKLQSLYGIRSFLCFWIAVNHCVFFLLDELYNVADGVYISDNMAIQIFTNSEFFVDSFLAISGFLLGYFFVDANRKRFDVSKLSLKKKISHIITMIRNRYLRLTPAYLFAIGLSESLAQWRYAESIYWRIERPDVNCPKYWWRNLIYINNWFPRSELCMTWSWNLSADMQLYFVCSCVLVLTSVNFKRTALTLLLILIACNTYAGYVSYSLGFQPYLNNEYVYFKDMYASSWIRIGPYIMGVFGGYILSYWNGRLPLSKVQINLCWFASITIFCTLLFAFPDKGFTLINSAIYAGWSRTFWGLATTWFVIGCVSENGGLHHLSSYSNSWISFSRVTYSIFITQPILLISLSSFRESPNEVEPVNIVVYGLGVTVISYVFAVIFSILFECPFMSTLYVLFLKSNTTTNCTPALHSKETSKLK